MKPITVRHRNGECLVRVEADDSLYAELLSLAARRPVLIVTDENVASLHLAMLQSLLPHATSLVLPAGEPAKTIATVERIWTRLAEPGYGRDTILVALGGGVIGDMTGFAAACWMRGVDYVQLPTTLLAQVDAAIGGKTGVNLAAGKNLVGAFHQPLAVFADTRTLASVPVREFTAGIAEIVKAALIADSALFDWLSDNIEALRAQENTALVHAIGRSCAIKAAIVSDDEHEHGRRMLLNLGHTFAHALENITGYQRFLHGEAVAIGLVLAAECSERHAGLAAAVRARLVRLLEAAGLPVRVPDDIDREALLLAMRLDKKHRQARWRLVLLEAPGHAVVREFANAAEISDVLKAHR